MAYVDFLGPAIQFAVEAKDLDEKKEYEKAYVSYMKSLDFFQAALKYEKNAEKKKMISEKMISLINRAEQLKEIKGKPEPKGGGHKGGPGVASKEKDSDKESKDEDQEKLHGQLNSAILREKPNVKWGDVAGLEGAKEALQEAVILPTRYPHLFTGNRSPWKGILLYGPPGTGKSYLAKAVATEAEAMFYTVSPADLLSKWLGESEKLVRQLFQMARESKPSVIFIDEIDSLCSTRGDNESEAARRVKTEFLVNMQGVGGGDNNDRVLVLAATNIPWGLDSAIRRRFERRIYIALPEVAARKQMFKIHIGKTPNDLTEEDFDELAEKTEMYSGSDIFTLVRYALMEPIRRCRSATHFKQVTGKDPETGEDRTDMLTPCSPGDQGAVEMKMLTIEPRRLAPPMVSLGDFLRALKTARPSVSEGDLKNFEDFTKSFGQEG